jgi:hypothetical protein
MNLHTACIQRNETQSQWWTHGPNEEGAYLSASKQSEHHSSASEWINAHHAPPHGAHEHPAREQDRRRDSTRIVRCTSPASSPLPRFYIRILYHAGMAHRALRGSPCGCSAARTTPSFRPEKGRDSAHKVLSNGRSTRAFFLSSLAPSASSSRPLLALPAQSSTWTFCTFLLRYWYADSMFFFLSRRARSLPHPQHYYSTHIRILRFYETAAASRPRPHIHRTDHARLDKGH